MKNTLIFSNVMDLVMEILYKHEENIRYVFQIVP